MGILVHPLSFLFLKDLLDSQSSGSEAKSPKKPSTESFRLHLNPKPKVKQELPLKRRRGREKTRRVNPMVSLALQFQLYLWARRHLNMGSQQKKLGFLGTREVSKEKVMHIQQMSRTSATRNL